MDLPLAVVGFCNCGVNYLEHHWRNVHPSAITFDVRNDGLVRNRQRHVGVNNDFFALGGHLDMLIQVTISQKKTTLYAKCT